MSRPSSCSGVYGLTSAMRNFGSLIHRKGAIMVTTVPIMMTPVARSRNVTGFFSIMIAPFLGFLLRSYRFTAGRCLDEVIDKDQKACEIDDYAERPAVP